MRLNPELERKCLELAGELPTSAKAIEGITEKAFMAEVQKYAKRCGWRCYHTYNSRRSQAGFPDLCMARSDRLIFAELKTETGELTADQSNWIEDLRKVGPPVEVYLWRPRDWELIERILT